MDNPVVNSVDDTFVKKKNCILFRAYVICINMCAHAMYVYVVYVCVPLHLGRQGPEAFTFTLFSHRPFPPPVQNPFFDGQTEGRSCCRLRVSE